MSDRVVVVPPRHFAACMAVLATIAVATGGPEPSDERAPSPLAGNRAERRARRARGAP